MRFDLYLAVILSGKGRGAKRRGKYRRKGKGQDTFSYAFSFSVLRVYGKVKRHRIAVITGIQGIAGGKMQGNRLFASLCFKVGAHRVLTVNRLRIRSSLLCRYRVVKLGCAGCQLIVRFKGNPQSLSLIQADICSCDVEIFFVGDFLRVCVFFCFSSTVPGMVTV